MNHFNSSVAANLIRIATSSFCRATILATGAENSGKNWLLGKEFGGAYDAGQRIPENGG